jgi:hypothetical protein
MRIPTIRGTIKRRLLVNFRADPAVVQQILPEPFRPKLHGRHSLVGICLIRLEQIRPAGLPGVLGLSSENAAHRIAVEWTDGAGIQREGASVSGIARVEASLHEVHYVIQPHWTAVFAFILCLLLACGIGFLGYSQTKHFVERKISLSEPNGPGNGSQRLRQE